MWVTKLLISQVKKKDFLPQNDQIWHFWSIWARPCRLLRCPVGGSVGGCCARAVSRKTPIYFMQEQRYIVRGWANKSGAELQKLCDPLWKALSKEEKAVYKEQKKSLKMTKMEQHFQARIPQEAKRVEFEGKMWRVRVASRA